MKRIEDMTPKEFDRWLYLIAACFFLFCCWLFLSGCKIFKMSQVRAAKKIANVEQQQPQVLYNFCSTRFPPVTIDSTHTEYVKGETVWRYDTVTVDCDSVVSSPKSEGSKLSAPHIVRIPCPPCPISVDTFKYYKFLAQENGAKVSALTIELNNAKQDNAVLSAKVHAKNIWLWVLGALAAVMVIWKVANLLKWVGV